MKIVVKEVYVSVEDFINFLKDNDALDKFMLNSHVDIDFSQDFIHNWLIFEWEDSPEGYDYWNNLNEKWRKYIFYPSLPSLENYHYCGIRNQ